MANKIESRIVSLTFDNAQFEKNVATSRKTLRDLDEQIKFKDADKSFSNLSKAAEKVNFGSMVSSAGTIGVAIEKAMSLGTIAVERLKNKVVDIGQELISKVMKPITDAGEQIVNGGWKRATNIDKAKFKMAGLGVEWDKISKDIDYGVKDTQFGLDAAATAAANLASTGVEFGEVFGPTGSSPMAKSLRGISGLAATFDRSYDDIAGIYQVVAASGHVTNDALSRFTERGIPVLGELGKALGKTDEEVKQMAKDGTISFEYFANAMDKAFGEHATKANETFEGSLDNMHSALSRTGEKFATAYRANMVDVYNSLRLMVNGINGVLNGSTDDPGAILKTADAIMQDLATRFISIVDKFNEMVVQSGALKNVFEGVANIGEGVYSVITEIIDAFITVKNSLNPVTKGMEKIFDATQIEEFNKALEVNKITKPARQFAALAEKFREFVQSEEFISKVVKAVEKIVKIGKTIGSIVKTLFGYVKDIFKAITDTIGEIAGATKGGKKASFLDAIVIGLQALDKALKSKFMVTVIDYITKAIRFLGVAIPAVIGWVKSAIEWIKEAYAWIVEAGKTAVNWTKNVWNIVVGWVKDMAKAFDEWFTNLTGKSVGDVFNTIVDAVKKAWEGIKWFFTSIPGWVDVAKEKFSGWVETVRNSSLAEHFNNLKETVKEVWEKIKDFFSSLAKSKDVDEATEKLSPFARIWEAVKNVFSGVVEFFKAAWPIVSTIFSSIATVVGDLFGKLKELIGGIDLSSFDLAGTLTGTGLAAGGAGLFILFDKIGDIVDSLFGKKGVFGEKGFLSKITAPFTAIKDVLVEYQQDIKADAILTIAKAVAVLAASLFIVALLDTNKIAAAGLAIGGLLEALGKIAEDLYGVADKGSDGADYGLKQMATSMLLLSAGVLLLAFAAARLSAIKVGDLAVGLLALHFILEEVRNTMKSMAGLEDKNMNKMGLVLLMLAFAVTKLVKPIQLFGTMNIMELLQGIIALKVVMKILSDTFELLDRASKTWSSSKDMETAVKMIKGIAFAMLLMVVPVKMFGMMDTNQLAKGVIAVMALIITMSAAMKMLAKETETLKGDKLKSTKNGSLAGVATALIGLATAMVILIFPLKQLADIEWEEIGKMGSILAGLLLILGLFNKFGGETTKALGTTVALLGLSVVLRLLIKPLQDLVDIGWEEIGKAGAIIAGLMLILGLFNNFGGSTTGALATTVALLGMALALKMLLEPLKGLAEIEWKTIGKAGAIVGGLLLAIAILGRPAAVALGALALAFVVFASGIYIVSLGLLNISVALGSLALVAAPAGKALAKMIEAVADAMPAVVDSIFNSAKGLVSGLLGLLETLLVSALNLIGNSIMAALQNIAKIVIGVVELMKSLESLLINDGIPTLARIVISAIDTVLQVLAEHWPSIQESLTIILEGLLQMLVDLNPKISEWLQSVLQILIDLLPQIKEFLIQLCLIVIEVTPYLSMAVMSLVVTLLNMLPGIVTLTVDALVDAFIALCDGIANRAQEIVDAALNMIWEIIKAIFIGVWKILDKIVKDIAELIGTIWPTVKEWFETKWEEIKTTGRELLEKLKEGIEEMWQNVVDKVTGIWDAITEFFDGIKDKIVGLGKTIIGWFKGGVDEESDSLYEAGANAGNKLVEGSENALEEHSPSKEGMDVGENYDLGMVKGVEGYSDLLYDSGALAGFNVADGSNTALADGLDLSILDDYASYIDGTSASPTISPVMESGGLTNLLSGDGSFNLSSIWSSEGGDGVLSSLSAIQDNQNNDTTSAEIVSLKEELLSLKDTIVEMIGANADIISGQVVPRISSLEQAMYNMQVVMDTNAVVGQIAPKIDESLGRYTVYKGRGN